MSAALIELAGIERIFYLGDSEVHALRHLELRIDSGEYLAVMGPSGSGKSTLLNLLGLLDTPTTGTVHYHGDDVAGLDKEARAKLRNEMVGFIFQFHYLLPEFSVYENVAMPALIGKTMHEAEIRARAEDTFKMLGLEGLGGKNANALSGGQKQRVAIARALMNRPSVILADEPTGNLDTVNTNLVYDLFRQINRETGTAFLIVTHDRTIAERTDRIVEICDGKMVQDVRTRDIVGNGEDGFPA
jgi:lipoprotein-releasing system ATP-binding protein